MRIGLVVLLVAANLAVLSLRARPVAPMRIGRMVHTLRHHAMEKARASGAPTYSFVSHVGPAGR
jgi:hypothetical protein